MLDGNYGFLDKCLDAINTDNFEPEELIRLSLDSSDYLYWYVPLYLKKLDFKDIIELMEVIEDKLKMVENDKGKVILETIKSQCIYVLDVNDNIVEVMDVVVNSFFDIFDGNGNLDYVRLIKDGGDGFTRMKIEERIEILKKLESIIGNWA